MPVALSKQENERLLTICKKAGATPILSHFLQTYFSQAFRLKRISHFHAKPPRQMEGAMAWLLRSLNIKVVTQEDTELK